MTGITNADDIPPSAQPNINDIKKSNLKNMKTVAITIADIRKFINPMNEPDPIPRRNDLSSICNAPTKRRNNSVNVVKTDADIPSCLGSNRLNTPGLIKYPIIISKSTSGMNSFLKMNSAI